MATKAQDTFTEGSDTDLIDHTPDTGTGYTTDLGGFEEDMLVEAATDQLAAHSLIVVGGGAREDTDIGDDDMDVSFTLASFGVNTRGSIVSGRIPSGTFDGDNAYTVVFDADSGNEFYGLQKRVAGTNTDLGNASVIPLANDVVKLEIRAGTKKIFIGGVEKFSSTDDSLTGNNFAGYVVVVRNEAIVDLDDFLSESVAAGGDDTDPYWIASGEQQPRFDPPEIIGY